MGDRILIRDLRLRTVIGVHDRERETPQEVVVGLALEADLSRPASSDELADAVDYGALARRVAGHVEGSRYRLLERLAGSIADLVLKHHRAVQAVTVTVDKPKASPLARSVAVELTRRRG